MGSRSEPVRSTPRDIRVRLRTYAAALGLVAAALLLRQALDPLLGDLYPFATTFLAVLAAASFFGLGPGVAASLVSAGAVSYLFIPPRGHITVDDGPHSVGQVLNFLVSLGIALLGGTVHRARARAERIAGEEQRQRTRLRSILDNASDALVSIDRDGAIEAFNPAAERLFGYAAGEVTGASIDRLVPDNRRGESQSVLGRVLRGENVQHFDTVRQDREGRAIDVSMSVSPIRDADGTVTGVSKIIRDVTERIRTEKTLREREEQLRLYAEHSPVAIAMFDSDMRYLVASHRWRDTYHLGDQPIIGRSHYEVFPEITERWRAIHRRCLAGAVERCDEDHFERADGTTSVIRWEIHPWNRADGSIGGIIIFSEDVTDRKRDEQAVRESEGRYRTLFEYAPDGILITDGRDVTVDANRSMCRLLGYTREELIGRPAASLTAESAPAEYDAPAQADGTPIESHRESQLRRRDGSTFAADVITTRMPDGNMLAMVRDVTERNDAIAALRTAEERMRFALESANVGIWDRDYTTGAVRWSAIMETHYGLAPGDSAVTRAVFADRVHPDDVAAVHEAMHNAERDGTDFSLHHRVVWPDGTVRWLEAAGRVHRDAAGRLLRGIGISIDVTGQRTLEEQYRQSQKMEAIGQLAGGIAHDFNNLLTAILGYSDFLRQGLGPLHSQYGDVEEIHRAATRASALVKQLLAFSRRQILEMKVLDPGRQLQQMENLLRRLIGEHIEVVVRSTATGRMKGDANQLEQVILNLAVNARDAMPDGGTLLIEVADSDIDDATTRRHVEIAPGRYVMVAVSDTGIGMDEATQARVFEPFFTTKGREQGTGLGLATVHGIVRQSGGYIWVYSEPGRGSTFKLFFPRVDAAADTVEPHVAPRGSLEGSETILIVEDEEGVRELARRVLERHGYRVLVTAAPGEALRVAGAHAETIDLLVTDVVLPEMSGRDLAEELLRRIPSLRVLYSSGYTDDIILHRGILQQGTPFLAKPFSPAALARKVREVLDAPGAAS